MSMVQFLDPRAEPGTPVEPYELGIDVARGPLTLGLVANGFPDSVAFLDHVETAVRDRLPEVTIRRWNKGNASATLSEQMLGEIVAECQAVVGAYGH